MLTSAVDAASVADENRLTPPNWPITKTTLQSATSYGPACMQQANVTVSTLGKLSKSALAVASQVPLFHQFDDQSEGKCFPKTRCLIGLTGDGFRFLDCLSINVQRPSGHGDGDKLPVVVFIHGGGYDFGGSSAYDGQYIVRRSASNKQPVIFVSFVCFTPSKPPAGLSCT